MMVGLVNLYQGVHIHDNDELTAVGVLFAVMPCRPLWG